MYMYDERGCLGMLHAYMNGVIYCCMAQICEHSQIPMKQVTTQCQKFLTQKKYSYRKPTKEKSPDSNHPSRKISNQATHTNHNVFA